MRRLGLPPLVDGGQRGLLLLLLALQGLERRLEALIPALVGRHNIHLRRAGLLSHASQVCTRSKALQGSSATESESISSQQSVLGACPLHSHLHIVTPTLEWQGRLGLQVGTLFVLQQ